MGFFFLEADVADEVCVGYFVIFGDLLLFDEENGVSTTDSFGVWAMRAEAGECLYGQHNTTRQMVRNQCETDTSSERHEQGGTGKDGSTLSHS
jgi:hypothetical protein